MSEELHRVLPMYLSGTGPKGARWVYLPLMVAINAASLGVIVFGGVVGALLALRWFG